MKKLFTLLFAITISQIYSQNITNKVSIKIHDIKGYGAYEEFAKKSVEKLEELLNSKEFEDEFIKTKMTQRKGKNKKELLNSILAAKETSFDSGKKNTIDVRLRVMSLEEDGAKWMKNCVVGSKQGTIGKEADSLGYTVTCKERIKLWADNENYGCMAGHIMHEYLHNIGFKHKWYSKRKSVVYKTGNLVRILINGNNESCPVK